MKKPPFQLTRRPKRWLYAVASVLFLSGALCWLADLAPNRAWPGADLARAGKPSRLKLHGGAAMGFLFVLGTLWPNPSPAPGRRS